MAGLFGHKFQIIGTNPNDYRTEFEKIVKSMGNATSFSGVISAGWSIFVFGYKANNNYSIFYYMTYNIMEIKVLMRTYEGTITWYN